MLRGCWESSASTLLTISATLPAGTTTSISSDRGSAVAPPCPPPWAFEFAVGGRGGLVRRLSQLNWQASRSRVYRLRLWIRRTPFRLLRAPWQAVVVSGELGERRWESRFAAVALDARLLRRSSKQSRPTATGGVTPTGRATRVPSGGLPDATGGGG